MIENILVFLIGGALFLPHLIFSSALQESFDLPKAAACFSLLALILPLFAFWCRKRELQFRFPWDAVLLGFCVAVGLSVLGTKDKSLFFFEFCFLMAAYAFYLVSRSLINTPQRINFCLGLLWAAGFCMAIVGLWEYLLYREIISYRSWLPVPYMPAAVRFYKNRIISTQGQPNNMGLFLSLGLIINFHFLIDTPRLDRVKVIGLLLPLGLIFFIIEASGGLGLYSSAAGLLGYLLLVVVSSGWGELARVRGRLAAAVLALTITFGLAQQPPDSSSKSSSAFQRTQEVLTLTVTSSIPDNTMTHRLQYWGVAWEMFRSSPLWGVGLGGFGRSFAQAQAKFVEHTNLDFTKKNARFVVYAHNEFLHLLAETGILGFGFFVLLWGMIFYYTKRTLASSPSTQLILTVSLFIPYLVQFMASAPLRRINLVFTLAFLLGVWARQIPLFTRRSWKLPPWLGITCVCLTIPLSLLLSYKVYENWRAGKLYQRTVILAAKGGWNLLSKVDWGTKIMVNPYFSHDWPPFLAYYALQEGRRSRRRVLLELAEKNYRKALDEQPSNFYCRRLAEVYFSLGQEQEGLHYLKQGVEYVPSDGELLKQLVGYYLYKKDNTQAAFWAAWLLKYGPSLSPEMKTKMEEIVANPMETEN